ncbi:hypothetical protein ECZU34_58770 [Escherichia coli]|nr:hypothetical protein ECZU34_58770 [Escherichia coli]
MVRVKFVKSAQRLGFSLDEIAELLRLDDGTHCEEASSGRTQAQGRAREDGRLGAHGNRAV